MAVSATCLSRNKKRWNRSQHSDCRSLSNTAKRKGFLARWNVQPIKSKLHVQRCFVFEFTLSTNPADKLCCLWPVATWGCLVCTVALSLSLVGGKVHWNDNWQLCVSMLLSARRTWRWRSCGCVINISMICTTVQCHVSFFVCVTRCWIKEHCLDCFLNNIVLLLVVLVGVSIVNEN